MADTSPEFMNFQPWRTRADGYRLIVGYLGVVAVLVGTIVLLPLVFLIAFPDEMPYAVDFIAPGAASITIGYLLSLFVRGKSRGQLQKHQDSVVIVSSWIIAIAVSALPFMLTGRYNLTQALFEATSGFSTTAFSVVDVEHCPKIFLAFRSIMQFFGGVGFVLVMTSVLPDRRGMRLYSAESPIDRLIPSLAKSARMILAVYSGYMASGTFLYIVAGMGWFDALNHSIAALSNGGFSTKAQSIGFYGSVPIELVTMVLMLLGSTNYFVHILILKGKFAGWMRHCETTFTIILIAITAPVVGVFLLGLSAGNLPHAARLALFQTVSALTTTGFHTARDIASWPSSSILILIALMLTGGGAGSAAGGIKQTRAVILLKSILWDMRNKFCSKRIIKEDSIHHFGVKDFIADEDKHQAGLFILLYLSIFALGTLAYCFFGYSIQDSAFEFASALGTVGLSTGITAYGAPAGVLWIGIAGMFLGRLEIYVVFMGIARIVKDAGNKIRGR